MRWACRWRASSAAWARSNRPGRRGRRRGAAGTLSHDQLLTDPDQAVISWQTGVDALAIAIGTSHGAYKFTAKPTGDILAIDRIAPSTRRSPPRTW